MYTVDASVWVNAFDQREPGHETSRRFLEVLQTQALAVVVPNLLCVEIAGAISRTRGEPARAQEFAVALHADCTLVSLDHEHLTRLTAVVPACAPAAALAQTQAPFTDE